VASVADIHAREIHGRVERWALDEAALPGELVSQLIDWLYRENRFCEGNLKIANNPIGPATLTAPTLAVVNVADDVAPSVSVKPFIDAMPTRDIRILEIPGERGVCLQHLAILIGRNARAVVWPEIIFWMDSHADPRVPARRALNEPVDDTYKCPLGP